MRQYRGMPIGGKEFVYGWYGEIRGEHFIIPDMAYMFYRYRGCYAIADFIKVILETVGQRLPFDAQNGDKIYEGDFVAHSCGDLFIVESTKTGWNPFDYYCVEFHRVECVVGNIHQHPELKERAKRESETFMKYILYNKKKNKYFKEYQGNKPVWCDSILDAVQYHTMIALRMQKRLVCQSQEVTLLAVQYKGFIEGNCLKPLKHI